VFDYSAATAYDNASPAALKNVAVVYALNAKIRPNTSTGHVADFSGGTLYFLVSPSAVAGEKLLIVEGDADISGVTVHLDTPSGRPGINVGQHVVLLDVTGNLDDGGFAKLLVTTSSGDTYTIEVDGNQLWAILAAISPTGPAYERLKAYAESSIAKLSFINQGLDFLLTQGFGSVMVVTSGEGVRFSTFGSMGGGQIRNNSGSHVDVSGVSLLAGLAIGNDISATRRLTLGAFLEGGWGTYNSYNSFANHASAKGKGDTNYNYYGGGFLGRYDVVQGTFAGLYADASARLGWSKADFRSNDILYNGNRASFDSSSLYYGMHAGVGYVLCLIPEKASLDFSGKILWTHQDSDSVTVHQDRVRFADADSLRTRLGGRFAWAVNELLAPYAGAYWEYEFDGRTKATVNGISVGTPSLRGNTGMGELGFALTLMKTLSLDFGVQGYVGKREGWTGSLQVKYEF